MDMTVFTLLKNTSGKDQRSPVLPYLIPWHLIHAICKSLSLSVKGFALSVNLHFVCTLNKDVGPLRVAVTKVQIALLLNI